MSKPELRITRSESFRQISASAIVILHTPVEFRIMIYTDYPEYGPDLKVKSIERVREMDIVLSPQHAKILLGALKANIERYEKQFGEIRPMPKAPPVKPPEYAV